MTTVKTEKLFSAIKEAVVALFNVNDKYFVMITKKDDSYYVCYFYSKSRLEPAKGDLIVIEKDLRDEIWESSIGGKLFSRESIPEAESIMLNKGKVYILDGNLMLERR